MDNLDYIGTDTLSDAIRSGYGRKKALKQHKEMIDGIERAMRLKGRGGRACNPIDPNKADILPWVLYDTLGTAPSTATVTEFDAFTTPISATKPKGMTNLQQVQQLPAPQHFNCTAMKIYFDSQMHLADIQQFISQYYCEFWIGDKVYAQGPIFEFPQGGGITGYTTATNQQSWGNGFMNPNAIVDFRMGDNPIGHHILQGQNFYVKFLATNVFTTSSNSFLNANATAQALSFLTVLEGILSRGVQ
jgi:hypothetical protein